MSTNLTAAASGYQNTCNAMKNGPYGEDLEEFKTAKNNFKNLIHQFINRGGTADMLLGRKGNESESNLPRALQPKTEKASKQKDRIEQKIKRFFKKHKPEAEKGQPLELFGNIVRAAQDLAAIYPTIDQANFGTEERPVSYIDFRKSKGVYKRAANEVFAKTSRRAFAGLRAGLATASDLNLSEKALKKLDTFRKKFDSKRHKESKPSNCTPIAIAVGAFAIGVLILHQTGLNSMTL